MFDNRSISKKSAKTINSRKIMQEAEVNYFDPFYFKDNPLINQMQNRAQ
jgi:hypothetical protein